MAQPHLPTSSEVALLVALLIQRYSAERGKEVSRFRLARSSLRRLAMRARLRDALVDEWVDVMALEHGWLVFADAEEFLLLRKNSAATWTKIADSDEAARVHRSDAARRSNLMAPTILK